MLPSLEDCREATEFLVSLPPSDGRTQLYRFVEQVEEEHIPPLEPWEYESGFRINPKATAILIKNYERGILGKSSFIMELRTLISGFQHPEGVQFHALEK